MAFQILSLSGGGFLGLYSISILADLEKDLGRPIASSFDLIAGTSVGGIIALALAAEHPASEIKFKFEQNGTRIFSDRPVPQTSFGKFLDTARYLFRSKYDGEWLRKTIISVIGEDTLIGDLKHPTIIPVVNLSKGKPQIFKTDHHASFVLDHKQRAVDVAVATSAAPTFFPIAEIGDEMFADGGLYANSPDLIALHEAEHFLGISVDQIRVLSIGTTTTQFSLSHSEKRNLGILGWARSLPNTIISSQQIDIDYILRHRLGDRYVRIDTIQSKEQERDLGLDVATKEAQATIRGMARGSYQEIANNEMLNTILNNRARKPRFYYRNEKKEKH